MEQYFGKRCHDKKLPRETYAVRGVMGRGQRGKPDAQDTSEGPVLWNVSRVRISGVCF